MESITKIKNLYESFIKAKKHFEIGPNEHTFGEFVKIKHELYLELDKIFITEDRWINTLDKYHKCLTCSYSFYTPEKDIIKYRKIIHELFECDELLNLQNNNMNKN
jgi:hypothetical protein